jgi:hypothetical protein
MTSSQISLLVVNKLTPRCCVEFLILYEAALQAHAVDESPLAVWIHPLPIGMPNHLFRPQEQDRDRGTSILHFQDAIRKLSERRSKQLRTPIPAGRLGSI